MNFLSSALAATTTQKGWLVVFEHVDLALGPHSVVAVKSLEHAAEQASKRRLECQHMDPLLQQSAPLGSRWHVDAASGAMLDSTELKQNEPRQ